MRNIVYLAVLYVIVALLAGFWPFDESIVSTLCKSWGFGDCLF